MEAVNGRVGPMMGSLAVRRHRPVEGRHRCRGRNHGNGQERPLLVQPAKWRECDGGLHRVPGRADGIHAEFVFAPSTVGITVGDTNVRGVNFTLASTKSGHSETWSDSFSGSATKSDTAIVDATFARLGDQLGRWAF